METKLKEIREWAHGKIATGQEPPWAWYQYMKLIESVDSILSGLKCVKQMENLQHSVPHPGTPLRLVDSKYQQDTAQHHSDIVPVQMPT